MSWQHQQKLHKGAAWFRGCYRSVIKQNAIYQTIKILINMNECAKLNIVCPLKWFSTFSSSNATLMPHVVESCVILTFSSSSPAQFRLFISRGYLLSNPNRSSIDVVFVPFIERDSTQQQQAKLTRNFIFLLSFFPTAKLENMKSVYDRAWRVQDMKYFLRSVLHNWVTQNISWKIKKVFKSSFELIKKFHVQKLSEKSSVKSFITPEILHTKLFWKVKLCKHSRYMKLSWQQQQVVSAQWEKIKYRICSKKLQKRRRAAVWVQLTAHKWWTNRM